MKVLMINSAHEKGYRITTCSGAGASFSPTPFGLKKDQGFAKEAYTSNPLILRHVKRINVDAVV